jgi:hypothetical protein
MAIAQQQILRAARLESRLFTSCMNESFGPEGSPTLPFRQELAEGIEITRDLNRNFILADGFQLLARQGNSSPLFLRYQAQVERLYRRAVEEFERLKKLRPELPNEPISEDDPPSEPEENTSDSSNPDPAPNEPIPDCGAGCQPADRMLSGLPAEGRHPGPQPGVQSPAPVSSCCDILKNPIGHVAGRKTRCTDGWNAETPFTRNSVFSLGLLRGAVAVLHHRMVRLRRLESIPIPCALGNPQKVGR